jgi:hypothetical protein
MRSLILHIGNPKAGSTSLQHWLAGNRAGLAAAGIDYPLIGRGSDHNHRALAVALEGREDRATTEQLAGHLRAAVLGPAEAVVISAEQLEGAPDRLKLPDRFAALAREGGRAVTAVLFVRPQWAYVNSVYAQHVQRFFTARRFLPFQRGVIGERRYDYGRHYRQWADHPEIRLVVVPLVAAALTDGIEGAFLGAAGLSVPGLPASARHNESPGPATLETFRRLAGLGARHRIGAYQRGRGAIKSGAEKRGWNRQRFSGVGETLRGTIEARFAASNAAFADRFWGRPWADVFADELARPLVPNEYEAGRDAALDAEIDAIVGDILERFGRPETPFERIGRAIGLDLVRFRGG